MENPIIPTEPRKHKALYWLLAIVGVIIIASLIYTYTRRNNQPIADDVTDATQTELATGSATPTPEAVSPTSTPNIATKFLVVEELGIKIPLTATIEDLSYVYKCQNASGAETNRCLHFTAKSIASIPTSGGIETCEAMADPLGSYAIYSTRQSNEGTSDLEAGELLMSANGHYIYYRYTQYACGDNASDRDKVNSLIEPLREAMKQAQAN